MEENIYGYHGVVLCVDLSSKQISRQKLCKQDIHNYIGGRGLGVKLLWDLVSEPGLDPLSPKNPLIFMTGPFSGYPIPAASRTCVVTKSPCTSPRDKKYRYASSLTYSNVGGFLGPEIKLAGYDGIVITGKSEKLSYLMIDNDSVEIRDAEQFRGMRISIFDKTIGAELGKKKFKTCCIGPAGENLVSYACIMHRASRAAGRGAGCVMGSKNLKAIAVHGSEAPAVYDPERFNRYVKTAKKTISRMIKEESSPRLTLLRNYGTASILERSSDEHKIAVKNFKKSSFDNISRISAESSKKSIWNRESSCYSCPVMCKKRGEIKEGKYKGKVHGPEFETGIMLGSNLYVSKLKGLAKAASVCNDLGLDVISTGNVIGFLMEANEKKLIDDDFLDHLDLSWGNADAVIALIYKIANRDGIGDHASKGVKYLAEKIGQGSQGFAVHVKGLELAGWNDPDKGICYATSNRGGCHQTGSSSEDQNFRTILDSIGLCRFITYHGETDIPGSGKKGIAKLLEAETGTRWTFEKLLKAGERIFNLEKLFNIREGFTQIDDILPERYYESFDLSDKTYIYRNRDEFIRVLQNYYEDRGWDKETSKPTSDKIKELDLCNCVTQPNLKN